MQGKEIIYRIFKIVVTSGGRKEMHQRGTGGTRGIKVLKVLLMIYFLKQVDRYSGFYSLYSACLLYTVSCKYTYFISTPPNSIVQGHKNTFSIQYDQRTFIHSIVIECLYTVLLYCLF